MVLEIPTTYFKNKSKGCPRFFQTPSKTWQEIPKILSTYFENKPQLIPEIPTYFKNKSHRVPEILPNYFENKPQLIPEILWNHLKNMTKNPRDSFKLFKKHEKSSPRFFQTISKTNHNCSLRFFQTTSKIYQEIPEILSTYFKNKIRNSRDSFELLQKQDKRSSRFFQIISKTNRNWSLRFF